MACVNRLPLCAPFKSLICILIESIIRVNQQNKSTLLPIVRIILNEICHHSFGARVSVAHFVEYRENISHKLIASQNALKWKKKKTKKKKKMCDESRIEFSVESYGYCVLNDQFIGIKNK